MSIRGGVGFPARSVTVASDMDGATSRTPAMTPPSTKNSAGLHRSSVSLNTCTRSRKSGSVVRSLDISSHFPGLATL